MNNIAEIQLFNFCLVYLLLLIVLFIMKKCEINQSKLLFVASIRMTLQLIIAGFVLTYIFQNPHPIFTILYLLAMIIFAVHRVLSKNPNLNHRFKLAIIGSISFSGLAVLAFFYSRCRQRRFLSSSICYSFKRNDYGKCNDRRESWR